MTSSGLIDYLILMSGGLAAYWGLSRLTLRLAGEFAPGHRLLAGHVLAFTGFCLLAGLAMAEGRPLDFVIGIVNASSPVVELINDGPFARDAWLLCLVPVLFWIFIDQRLELIRIRQVYKAATPQPVPEAEPESEPEPESESEPGSLSPARNLLILSHMERSLSQPHRPAGQGADPKPDPKPKPEPGSLSPAQEQTILANMEQRLSQPAEPASPPRAATSRAGGRTTVATPYRLSALARLWPWLVSGLIILPVIAGIGWYVSYFGSRRPSRRTTLQQAHRDELYDAIGTWLTDAWIFIWTFARLYPLAAALFGLIGVLVLGWVIRFVIKRFGPGPMPPARAEQLARQLGQRIDDVRRSIAQGLKPGPDPQSRLSGGELEGLMASAAGLDRALRDEGFWLPRTDLVWDEHWDEDYLVFCLGCYTLLGPALRRGDWSGAKRLSRHPRLKELARALNIPRWEERWVPRPPKIDWRETLARSLRRF